MSPGAQPGARRDDPHAGGEVLVRGPELGAADIALVLLHGRGAGAHDIIGLVDAVAQRGAPPVSALAPQAAGSTWYPYPFLVAPERNQPYLDSALAGVELCVDRILAAGLPRERVVIAGFSQGACLASEYVARAGGAWGGMVALSGGLIGDRVDPERYATSLSGTTAFFGCSDVDAHIPEERVHASARLYEERSARVTTRIYPGMPHTVNDDEMVWLAGHLRSLATGARSVTEGDARA